MFALNEVKLLGNIGSELELKYIPSGDAVLNFSLATNESYKNKDGKQVDKTEWHRLVGWRTTAELIAKLAHKGSKMFVSGKLQTRKWDDKKGVTHYTTEILIRDFIMCDPLNSNDQSSYVEDKDDSDYPFPTDD